MEAIRPATRAAGGDTHSGLHRDGHRPRPPAGSASGTVDTVEVPAETFPEILQAGGPGHFAVPATPVCRCTLRRSAAPLSGG
jgi:hypothetical protein